MNGPRKSWVGLFAVLALSVVGARAETAIWFDDFETDAGIHWTTNSVWRVGKPSAGATNAISGVNCASTGLRTSAPANADVRLICTNYNGDEWLTVPDSSEFPRLRYWQWFNFVNAEGYVEMRTDSDTNWQTISQTNLGYGATANYGSGVWSRPSIDLSAFAGENVQFAFHFTSGPSGWGADPGWYIDDVTVEVDPPVFYVPEDFEYGLGDWSVDDGTWQVGKPTSGPKSGYGGSTNCAGTVLAGNYGWNMSTRLITPAFTVPSSTNVMLRFWQWYSFVNAGGVVEINDGAATTTTTITTNVTVTGTNLTPTLNTNLYQLFGALTAGYSTPLYWNSTIGAWTNATKAMGNVFDITGYYFEAGAAPFFTNVSGSVLDYRGSTNSVSPAAPATNVLVLQGMTWKSLHGGSDIPVGYFGTNQTTTYTYTTNITTNVTTTAAGDNWQPLTTTNKSYGGTVVASGNWTNATVSLSSYSGKTVEIAFHFLSGASGWGNAAGWYVDDVAVTAAPSLIVPTNQTISFGQTLTVSLSAANDLPDLAGTNFTFALATASTNLFVTTNGIVNWTNVAARPGTYVVNAKVTDDQVPPFSITNSFSITVRPLPSQLVLTNAAALTGTNGSRSFKLSIQSPWTNLWIVYASTNLKSASWTPIYTNKLGVSGAVSITDRLATNFLQRFYRAAYQ